MKTTESHAAPWGAQIGNRPYRRMAFGRASSLPERCDRVKRPQIANLRYSRWQICATIRGLLLLAALFPATVGAQSLWREEVSKPMFADKRAAGVGDILTVLVQENTSTTKDNKTATAKQSGLDASVSTFFYSPAASGLLTKGGTLPALKYSSKNDFTGGGTVNNSEKILARAAVRVLDVLPNKNLVIEGTRETAFSGERQTVTLRGIVRPEDVLANNTVFSYNIAEAKVQIVSKGTVSDSQKKGWFNRLWDKLTPF